MLKKIFIILFVYSSVFFFFYLSSLSSKHSLSVLQNNQFTTIIKYDLMLEMSSPNSEINPLEGYDNIKIYTYNGKIKSIIIINIPAITSNLSAIGSKNFPVSVT